MLVIPRSLFFGEVGETFVRVITRDPRICATSEKPGRNLQRVRRGTRNLRETPGETSAAQCALLRNPNLRSGETFRRTGETVLAGWRNLLPAADTRTMPREDLAPQRLGRAAAQRRIGIKGYGAEHLGRCKSRKLNLRRILRSNTGYNPGPLSERTALSGSVLRTKTPQNCGLERLFYLWREFRPEDLAEREGFEPSIRF